MKWRNNEVEQEKKNLHQHLAEAEPNRGRDIMGKIRNSHSKIKNFLSTCEDPLSDLGPGIKAHHNMQVHFIGFFFLIYLIHIPVVWEFRKYDFYPKESPWIRDSVGSMGYSDTQCNLGQMIPGMN